jgi:uncharacterized protein
MAASTLLALIDDIAMLLDDVALLTKLAAKKTSGVLGDDLALNAQQVSGVDPARELPVVWAVAKGSFVNKLILVPSALLISAFIPWAVTPLLMLGGLFLCYEGFEKLAHKFFESKDQTPAASAHPAIDKLATDIDLVAFEKEKIKGAIRTDFILSAEIIAITLGIVAQSSFTQQVLVLSGIAMLMTVGVYGLVAGIVKLDDLGLYWSRKQGGLQKLGHGLLWLAPWLMKFLSIAGTAAMFLVGGGILQHGIPALNTWVEQFNHLPSDSFVASFANTLIPFLAPMFLGLLAGALTLALVKAVSLVWPRKAI